MTKFAIIFIMFLMIYFAVKLGPVALKRFILKRYIVGKLTRFTFYFCRNLIRFIFNVRFSILFMLVYVISPIYFISILYLLWCVLSNDNANIMFLNNIDLNINYITGGDGPVGPYIPPPPPLPPPPALPPPPLVPAPVPPPPPVMNPFHPVFFTGGLPQSLPPTLELGIKIAAFCMGFAIPLSFFLIAWYENRTTVSPGEIKTFLEEYPGWEKSSEILEKRFDEIIRRKHAILADIERGKGTPGQSQELLICDAALNQLREERRRYVKFILNNIKLFVIPIIAFGVASLMHICDSFILYI